MQRNGSSVLTPSNTRGIYFVWVLQKPLFLFGGKGLLSVLGAGSFSRAQDGDRLVAVEVVGHPLGDQQLARLGE